MFRCLSALCLLTMVSVRPTPAGRPPLRLIQFTSGELSNRVGSTVILGSKEAIVVDCLAFAPDAAQEADSIAKMGVHLKLIYITHTDIDHYLGCAKFVERFPGTPVYMTPRALDRYNRVRNDAFGFSHGNIATKVRFPDSLVTVKPLPHDTLTVDGEQLVIYPDLQGDVIEAQNSFVWIPSLRTVLADDIVFNKVHVYLASVNTAADHRRWRESIALIASLHPLVVIASHKASLDTPDTPDVLDATDRYIAVFDSLRETSPDTAVFKTAMRERYPDYAGERSLRASSAVVYGLFTLPY